MCGIVGFIAPHNRGSYGADKIFPEMLFIDQLRGRDAVGMFGVHHSTPKHMDWIRAVGPADQFLREESVHKRFIKRLENYLFIVGHNRAATIGDRNNVAAAHPHKTENITLVHNGTLFAYEGRKKFISDSAAIASYLENLGGDFEKAREKFRGAYALVWHDARNNTLNFTRNYERPLTSVESSDGTLWFASEPWMAQAAIERNKKKAGRVEDFKTDVWYRYSLDTGKFEEEIKLSFRKGSSKKTGTQTPVPTIVTPDTTTSECANPEELRAFETVVNGANAILTFEQMKFEFGVAAPEPPPYVPPPSFSSGRFRAPIESNVIGFTPRQTHGRQNSDISTLRTNDQRRELKDWNGYERGDTVMFFPVQFRSTTDFKIALAGPMLVWVDNGVRFMDGVEVRGRINDKVFSEQKLEATEAGSVKAVFRVQEMNVPHEAVITQIHEDVTRKRIVLWVKDAYPQDWFNTDAYCDKNDVDNAWIRQCPALCVASSALEVADFTKKLRDNEMFYLLNTRVDEATHSIMINPKRMHPKQGILTNVESWARQLFSPSNVPSVRDSSRPSRHHFGS